MPDKRDNQEAQGAYTLIYSEIEAFKVKVKSKGSPAFNVMKGIKYGIESRLTAFLRVEKRGRSPKSVASRAVILVVVQQC
jgi:hypothetical protein